MTKKRIYLSPPHLSGIERQYVADVFDSNWIAPLGPNVDAFEKEFCTTTGAPCALALSSGTAALHLALLLLGVGRDDEVLVSSFTFSASVNPVVYLGGRPTFIDSERQSWNMDSGLLAEALEKRAKTGRLPKAVVLVHVYGQSADIDAIKTICAKYEVVLIEDAAEALGATYNDLFPGTFGRAGVFSFNGNKIVTTSGGGMLVSPDQELIEHARKLSQQAREALPHYEHTEIGYNYRMSNVLAAIGRGQLKALEERVRKKRWIFNYYLQMLGGLPGISFMPEAPWGRHSRWLSCITIEPKQFGIDREAVRLALEAENIESRPLWKPMHLQPVFKDCERFGGAVSQELFEKGLCLPSGTAMSESDLNRIVATIQHSQGKNIAAAARRCELQSRCSAPTKHAPGTRISTVRGSAEPPEKH